MTQPCLIYLHAISLVARMGLAVVERDGVALHLRPEEREHGVITHSPRR